jgi:hypothetical protein
MKAFLRSQKLALLGLVLGSVGGFLYYELIGKTVGQCKSGGCAITSNPIGSAIYGALFFAVLFSLFKKS